MKREALSEKILMLGVDGLDPRFMRHMLKKGKMPHVKAYIEQGVCREDLVMLGAHPTVTPPMWTTLACGCYANVHGITGFYRKSVLHEPGQIMAYHLPAQIQLLRQLCRCYLSIVAARFF